jgi:uncharacterized SAM-binding protein YcdF (DUF218 family)/lysophospholipase L1-like esterase
MASVAPISRTPAAPVSAAPAAPDPRVRTRRPPRRLVWFVLGVLSFLAVREAINRTTYADQLVASLLSRDTPGHADVIVVPAAGLTAACTPNLNSLRRTLLAARLYRAGRAPLVLFSGGRPRSGNLTCSVAAVMAKMAVEIGVPESAVRIEHESRTTHENAAESAPMLTAMGATRILLVTDRLHMVRAAASYAHFGFAIERATIPIYEGHRDNVDMLAAGLRELVAIRYYEWKGWIGDPWPEEARVRSGPAPRSAAAVAASTAAASPVEGNPVEGNPVQGNPVEATTAATATTTSPPAPDATMMQNMPANPAGPLVLLGASYAGGWKAATLGGLPVVNKGVAGQQSFELLARFDADVVSAQPRAVVLWGFANDVFRAPRERIADSMARMHASFIEMIARARAHGIEPIIATEVTIRAPNTWSDWAMSWVGWVLRKTSYQEYVNGHILAQNAWLRDTAKQQGLLLLDLQPVVAEASGARGRAYAQADGSHISEAGYEALAAYVNPRLAVHFKRP